MVEELEVDDSGKSLDTEYLKLKVNEFDDHALEEAVSLKENGEATEVVALAVEGEDTDKLLYTALAKGADKAVKLTGNQPADSHQFAMSFAGAISEGGYDLVLTGVQSVDDRDGQLGPILASCLDVPCVSVVTGINVSGGVATVHKEYSGGMMAEFEVDLPAVLGVQAARQTPRYAPVSKVRQLQQSENLEEVVVENLGPGEGSEVRAMSPPEKGEGAQMLSSAEELVAVLKEKGVI